MQAKGFTPSEYIDGVMDRLQRVGWQQGGPGTYESPNCLVGAMTYTMHDLVGPLSHIGRSETSAMMEQQRTAYGAIYRALQHFSGLPYRGVAGWNDAPERTLEDVLLVLKDARYELEAGGGTGN